MSTHLLMTGGKTRPDKQTLHQSEPDFNHKRADSKCLQKITLAAPIAISPERLAYKVASGALSGYRRPTKASTLMRRPQKFRFF